MSTPTIENLFKEVCVEWLSQNEGLSIRGEQGVFSYAMIVWLGIQQRLKGGSLRSSLRSLVERQRAGELDFLISRPNRKLRSMDVSLNSGGVSRARDRIPEGVMPQLYAAAARNIEARFRSADQSRPVYLLDGQVTAIARSESNIENFGQTFHGQGELHYPRIRIVAAHKLSSGVATKVAIGTWRDSEVKLARELFAELPKNALLVMDRGFDKPIFLEAAIGAGVDVLVRLKDSKAKKLLGESDNSSDSKVTSWLAKTADGRTITLSGKIIKFTSQIKGFRSDTFYIFSSDSSLSADEIAALYRKRVQVEVFIRDLKQKLNLSFISAKKAENVKKEILLAYLAFNLVRAIMFDTAIATNTDIQRLSFTATVSLCEAYAYAFLQGTHSAADLTAKFRKHLLQAKLPLRKHPRSYPRVVKAPRDKYPSAAIRHVNTEIGK